MKEHLRERCGNWVSLLCHVLEREPAGAGEGKDRAPTRGAELALESGSVAAVTGVC